MNSRIIFNYYLLAIFNAFNPKSLSKSDYFFYFNRMFMNRSYGRFEADKIDTDDTGLNII
jgi:hypothetical protein